MPRIRFSLGGRHTVVYSYLLLTVAGLAESASAQQPLAVATSVRNDTSPAALVLRAPVLAEDTAQRAVRPPRLNPQRAGQAPSQIDPAVQRTPGPRSSLIRVQGFDGLGEGFTGPQGSVTIGLAPPDPSGAIGRTQYVQATNVFLVIFDKATGAPVYGPVPTRSLWAGFGTACERENDGDPIVKYDQLAERWIITQFQVTDGYSQCVAVSETSDATGRYFRYEFAYPAMNDYPKLAVWPDAYYVSYNMFYGPPNGARMCAWEREKMLKGEPAREICAQLGTSQYSLLPSDLDGHTAPVSGTPNYALSLGRQSRSLNLWKFSVNWQNPGASSFGVGQNFNPNGSVPVAAFNDACGGGACIAQSGTTQLLESLGERLMYRLAYRRFDQHESLVVTHSVHSPNAKAALRWYEIRNPGGAPTVFQQGTYSPDEHARWMGSIAMDRRGNILVGYAMSSGAMFPSLGVSGRTSSDPAGVLGSEEMIVDGGGHQNGNLARWGDYSHMSIDPVDDCTFWYTAQYPYTTGSFNWRTRVAAFRFTDCGADAPTRVSDDDSPASLAAPPGEPGGPDTWGGEGIQLTVLANALRVTLVCAHGIIHGKLPDAGDFALLGQYVAERAGPVHLGHTTEPRTARYSGRRDGLHLTMGIEVDGLATALGPFRLRRGLMTRITRCV